VNFVINHPTPRVGTAIEVPDDLGRA